MADGLFAGAFPGSDDAIKKGCICPVDENNYGIGRTEDGKTIFTMVEACPLHGEGVRGRNPAAVKILDDALGKDRLKR